MAHVRDVGSEFEAPVESVWKFLASGEPHAMAHRSTRNLVATPAGEMVLLASMERHWIGRWVKVVNRYTLLPPLGVVTEVLEGPLAGSKYVAIYTPHGPKTGIEVYGEFTSPEISPPQIEPSARAWLAEMFEEDAPAVKAFAASP
jgi:hypothetical protein